jgi:prevent-host-death family protein
VATIVKVQEAKTRLSALLAEVEAGADIVIARGDVPVARLVPVNKPGPRVMGFLGYRVPESFFDQLPDEELGAWES